MFVEDVEEELLESRYEEAGFFVSTEKPLTFAVGESGRELPGE